MYNRPRIGVLYSRIRVEEKWIFAALEQRSVDYTRLDDRKIHFDVDNPVPWQQFDAILERSISYARGLYALKTLNAWRIPTVNTAAVAEACGDKIATANALSAAGVPQPRTTIAFTPESALEAIETLGYPAVLICQQDRWVVLDRNWTRTNDLFLVRSEREVSIVSIPYIWAVISIYSHM
jgi:[lysine-biosynthesis-protein LysW]--L-2-aminoadipate ligase